MSWRIISLSPPLFLSLPLNCHLTSFSSFQYFVRKKLVDPVIHSVKSIEDLRRIGMGPLIFTGGRGVGFKSLTLHNTNHSPRCRIPLGSCLFPGRTTNEVDVSLTTITTTTTTTISLATYWRHTGGIVYLLINCAAGGEISLQGY